MAQGDQSNPQQADGDARPVTGPARAMAALRGAAAWIKSHGRISAIAAAGLVVVLVSLVTLLSFVATSDDEVTLAMALDALDEGAFVEARHLAGRLKEKPRLGPNELGGPAFVLGAIAMHDAEDALGKNKSDYYTLAARHLTEASNHGFPIGREATGTLLLGRALYLSGQLKASRLALQQALELNPGHAREIHRLLARALLDDAYPDDRGALEHATAYLDDTDLTQAERDEGLLLQGQISFRLGDLDACRAALAGISERAAVRSEAMILEGRMLMHEAQQMQSDPDLTGTADGRQQIVDAWQAAIAMLRDAQAADTLENKTTAKSMYAIGLCLLALGDERAALDQLERTARLYYDSPEGLAATLEWGDLLRQLGRDDEAVEAYRTVLLRIDDPDAYRNPWLSLDTLRARILAAYDGYLAQNQFEYASLLVPQLDPLFPRTRAWELMAQCHSRWSRWLLQRAERMPPLEAEVTRQEGRAQAREAGKLYVRLARRRLVTREYPEDLWNAAESFLDGHDFTHAVQFFNRYLENEARQRRPRALVGLGQAYLAQDRLDEAIAACEECIEFFGRDAASFRARLVCSDAWLETNEPERAEKLLLDNLHGDYLSPGSREWQQSLFALGRLLHLERRYDEAVTRLEEAVARYPDAPQTLEARYLLADSYHQLAMQLALQTREANVTSARLAQLKQMQDQLRRAVEHYDLLQQQLTGMETKFELSTLQKATLRNCFFARAAALASLERYDAAIDAYSLATNRYQSSPVVLEAYVGTAEIYRRLQKTDEARGILQQAKIVLRRIPQDAPFHEVTNYSRDEWTNYLDWLLNL